MWMVFVFWFLMNALTDNFDLRMHFTQVGLCVPPIFNCSRWWWIHFIFVYRFFLSAVLKDVDLEKTSTKAVRQLLEMKLGCDLGARRKEINEIVEKYVEENLKAPESEESSAESEASVDEKPAKRAAAPAPKKQAAKRKKASADSDDGGEPKKAKPKKANAFTRPFKLSPELAKLMDAEALPRHEVVKKVWAIIKERNLYDPKNKQFAVCDADLLTVMGVKRFRTFGMLKYLKKHFVE